MADGRIRPKGGLAPAEVATKFETVSTRDHVAEADAHQIGIYRRMNPSQRLAIAMQMNRSMRELMDSGLRITHPQLSAGERRQEIARRIRHARG
jgi:hypothetical protein